MRKLKFKKEKKGQVPSILTWIVGFLVIFFIMFFFIPLSLLIAGEKKVSGEVSEIEPEKAEGNLILTEQLLAFLNTQVEFEGEEKKVKDLMILMLEPYLKEDFLESAKISDINNLYLRLPHISKEIFILQGIDKEEVDKRNDKIIENLDKVFAEPCKDYIIKFPLGYLYKERGQEMRIVNEDYISIELSKEHLAFFKSADINLFHKSYKIKIIYQERDYCLEKLK